MNQNISCPPILEKILLKRGVPKEEIPSFFSWNLRKLPSLLKIHDLEKASLRILEAIENKEKIGVYGDYDVDGTTSCALLYHFFRLIGLEDKAIYIYQPSRFKEGYGLHLSSIDQALKDGVKVLITVDCGISNQKEAEYALSQDLDLIITDHHKDAGPCTPKAYAVINPNRRDEDKDSPLKVLAGVGVAFCLCLQIRELLIKRKKDCPSIYELLQFFAIGTISDLAPLSPLNLTLTRHGLKQLAQTHYPGLQTFFTPEERQRGMVLSDKISFQIGPMINSKGRLDHPELALNLLTSRGGENAYSLHSQLLECNQERKALQAQVFTEAKEMLAPIVDDKHLVSIVYDPQWHEGVIGIVASKLVETYRVPALVFTDSEEPGLVKASARTAGNLNLFDSLKKLDSLFIKFGGHAAAAGLSMKKENLPILKKELETLLKEIPHPLRTLQKTFDLSIEIDQIDFELIKSLEALEPYGSGNPRPIFRLENAKLRSYRVLKDLHVKWFFESGKSQRRLEGISFNYIGAYGKPSPDFIFQNQELRGPKYLCTLGINHFQGNEQIQIMVDEVLI